MIIRVLGHQAPREPLLFLLWMTLTSLTSDLCAMRSSNTDLRPRKSATNSKPYHELKPRISNMQMQNDFPYRYVFPANHPFSNYAQYVGSHPNPTAPSSNSHSMYDVYATSSAPQQYRSTNQMPAEYNKFIFKPPYNQPYTSPNPAPVSPIPFHPTPSPVILLLHAGQPSTGPYQTYMLIPTDNGNQPLHNLPPPPQPVHHHHHQPQTYTNLVPTIQYATNPPYSLPLRTNIIPITAATLPSPVITHPSQFLKPSVNTYQTQMVQRPVNIYQLPNGKYYPQKKNSIESKSSSIDNDKSESQSQPVTTSTERTPEKLNIGNHISSLNSTVE